MADQGPVVLNGRYELHRRIARGGMAEVVLARDQLLDRPVAVKILFPEYSTDAAFVERFRREAQAAAGLNHPNIVGVYDWGREGNTYFIVMEYVDGRSLADVLRAEGTLHPDRAADITTDVAAALGFAHRNGVVHRDVKPGNVLISSAGLVKVTDFGIARAITSSGEEALTQTGSVMGTATYFSPEQAQGKAVDPRSDLYSLGIVMYEMVCGKAPFSADNPVAVAYKHVQEPVVPPSQVNPTVPPAYEAITMQLLAKSPNDRYPSAEDLRADLRRFREGREVHAAGAVLAGAAATAAMTTVAAAIDQTPPGGTRAMPRYDPYDAQPARRHTAWFVVGLVLAVLVVGGLVFLAYRTLGAGGGDTVTVPDVRNQTTIEAQRILEAKGFVVKTRLEPSSAVDQNDVIRTDPAAGEDAKRGSTVIVYSSSGAPGTMPKVIGMTRSDAVTTLGNAGIDSDHITMKATRNDACKTGTVTRSSPVPTSDISSATRVTLWVCAGPSSQVPGGLAGGTVAAAQAALQGAGYQTSQRGDFSTTVEKGRVIGTEPAGGTYLAAGETVTIVVSEGVQPTTTQPPETTAPPTTAAPATTAPPATTTAPPTSAPTSTAAP
jgi:serine/threonine-protein kinase